MPHTQCHSNGQLHSDNRHEVTSKPNQKSGLAACETANKRGQYERCGIPRGQYDVGPPDPNLACALIAYMMGEKVDSICAQFTVYEPELYRWIKRLEIVWRGRRENYRKFKACKWCNNPMSREVIKRQLLYCGDKCRKAGINAYYEKLRSEKRADEAPKLCPACGDEVWISEDTYCNAKCAKIGLEKKTKARSDEILKLAHLPTCTIATRLGLTMRAVRYRLEVARARQRK